MDRQAAEHRSLPVNAECRMPKIEYLWHLAFVIRH
jgi:hypothetical protein